MPTSLGGLHASASIRAALASEREKSDVPSVGRPPALRRDRRCQGSADATSVPCAASPPERAQRRPGSRPQLSTEAPALVERRAFRPSLGGSLPPPLHVAQA